LEKRGKKGSIPARLGSHQRKGEKEIARPDRKIISGPRGRKDIKGKAIQRKNGRDNLIGEMVAKKKVSKKFKKEHRGWRKEGGRNKNAKYKT